MKRETQLRRRLHTLDVLHDAVLAMRSLAAHHFRIVRQTLPAARQYRDRIETIVAEIGIHQVPRANAPGGILVVASDLGLCGDYNSRLAQYAVQQCAERRMGTVYSVGRRVPPHLARAGVTPQRAYDAPASRDGVLRLLLNLAHDLMEDFRTTRIGSLYLVGAHFDGIGHFTPLCTRLLPLEPVRATAPVRRSPYLTPTRVAADAIREFLYIVLYELLLDSLASEHGMRLTAAEAALEWIERATDKASRSLSTARSEASTQELLDIVAGGKSRRRNR